MEEGRRLDLDALDEAKRGAQAHRGVVLLSLASVGTFCG